MTTNSSPPPPCDGCIYHVTRPGGWSLCDRTAGSEARRPPSQRTAWRYSEVERASILPWKCGRGGRYFYPVNQEA